MSGLWRVRTSVPYTVVLQDGTSQVIQSPVINTITGAMAIQEWFDRAAWAAQADNPVAYAPHLRRRPLPSESARPILFQFAKGDQQVDNPLTTAVLRAGDLADRATLYRHDLACAENPTCRKPGHGFMVATALFGAVSRGAQEQIATFFASDGTLVIHPEPARFFEVPQLAAARGSWLYPLTDPRVQVRSLEASMERRSSTEAGSERGHGRRRVQARVDQRFRNVYPYVYTSCDHENR